MLTSRHIEEDCREVRQNREVCSKVQCLVIRTKLGGRLDESQRRRQCECGCRAEWPLTTVLQEKYSDDESQQMPCHVYNSGFCVERDMQNHLRRSLYLFSLCYITN